MMQYDKKTMGQLANDMNFVRDTLEKVCRLTDVLEVVYSEPLLSDCLALKGGTAINLTVFDLPRLSLDIDFDFTKNVKRDDMANTRKEINTQIGKYMNAMGYFLTIDTRVHHALDGLVYSYKNSGGTKDTIKVETNYMLRTHVLPLVEKEVEFPWMQRPITIKTVDPIEIYGAKTVALLTRSAPRDLYDIHSMVQAHIFDQEQENMLRKCAMFYYALTADQIPENFDFKNMNSISQQRIRTDLVPVLHKGEWFDVASVQQTVSAYLQRVLSPTDREREFWQSFKEKQYRPELLFDDKKILSRIKHHPMAAWKCRNQTQGLSIEH